MKNFNIQVIEDGHVEEAQYCYSIDDAIRYLKKLKKKNKDETEEEEE